MSIIATRRRQRVLHLDLPYTLVQPESLLPTLLRSALLAQHRSNFIYVCVDHGSVLGYVEAHSRRRRRDEWAIATLATTERAPDAVWGDLLEELCRAAGEEGVARVFVKAPSEARELGLFRSLGFTHYSNEHVWGNLYFAPGGARLDEPPRGSLRRQTNQDAWDVMQLYTAVTPPAVQRAEVLTSRQWQVGYIQRPLLFPHGLLERSYVWPDQSGDKRALGGYIRLLTGQRGHWISALFRPDHANRKMHTVAFDYALWKAAQHGSKPVYCGIREYQIEVESMLEERGFHLLSEQALLVKYLAEPLKARQPALAPFLATNHGDLVTTRFSGK